METTVKSHDNPKFDKKVFLNWDKDKRYQDIQHNDLQHNDIQHNDTQRLDLIETICVKDTTHKN
jgi:hypothetical protein